MEVDVDDIINSLLIAISNAGFRVQDSANILHDVLQGRRGGDPTIYLTRVIECQLELQVYLYSLLAVLVRRYNSKEVRDKINLGSDSGTREHEYWRIMYFRGPLKVRAEEFARHVAGVGEIVGKDYFSASRSGKLDLYYMAQYIAYTMNINRGLLSLARELLNQLKRIPWYRKHGSQNPEPA